MALKDPTKNLNAYLSLPPIVRHSTNGRLWSSYDEDADVLYVRFAKPHHGQQDNRRHHLAL